MNYKGIIIISLFNIIISTFVFLFPNEQRIQIMLTLAYKSDGSILNVFTYSLIHSDATHLLSNMLIFALFGFFLEPIMGTKKIVILYIISGILSVFLMDIFQTLLKPCIGASGAVSSMLGATFLMQKTPFILTGISILFLGVEFAAIYNGVVDGVAHQAHLIGFLIGMLFNYQQIIK